MYSRLAHLYALVMLCTAGCNFADNAPKADAPPEDIEKAEDCTAQNKPEGDFICQDGSWMPAVGTVPGMCDPASDSELCARFGAQCSTINLIDGCGTARAVPCGACAEGLTCNTENLLCECLPQTDEELCMALGWECGNARTLDNCGIPRQVECGTCTESSVTCEENTCTGCVPQTNSELCQAQSATCGLINDTLDNCGEPRTGVVCGACNDASETCNTENTCECLPEDDQTFCIRQGAACGALSAMDNCGMMRTVSDCGTCTSGSCETTSNTCSVCTPESDADFCTRLGATCGAKTALDNCGTMRADVSCGVCGRGEQCAGNLCECPALICSANSCGELSSACGATEDCGECAGRDEVCTNNTCMCPALSCVAEGVECGMIQNGCGNATDCGACRGAHDACLGGTCFCQAESNAALCLQEGAQCGNITATDRCGNTRSIPCGGCQSGEWCINNDYCCPQGMICDDPIER